MRGLIATTAFAIAAAVGSGVDAATCTNSQVQYIYQLYQSAASYSGCSPYAKYDTSGITISWTCSSTSCIPMMQALADKLPSCEYASNGVNNKVNLLKALYTTCRVCTDAQQATITSLWKQAAATSSCSPYSSSSGSSTSFSWPCSATGCTAVLKDLASKVPDCYTNGVNEKTRILSPVSTCSSVNPSPATPSPSKTSTSGSTSTPSTASPSYGGGSGGTCTDAQAASSSSLWEAAAATSACSPYASKTFDLISISWPCRVTSCTAVMETLGESLPDCVLSGNTKSEKQSVEAAVKYCESGGTSGGDSDTTTAPSPTYDSQYSTDACSIAETAETVDLYYDVATSDECKSYATITTYRIYISAPCTSSCVTVGFQKLATNLDDCYYEYDGENKKKQVNNELQSKCSPKSGRKLLGDVSEASYVTVEYTTKTAISKGTTKPPSSSVSPGKSGAVAHVAATSSAVVLVTAALLAL